MYIKELGNSGNFLRMVYETKSIKISNCERKEKFPIKNFDYYCERINGGTAGKFEKGVKLRDAPKNF